MSKKIKLEKLVADAGKNVKDLFDNAIRTVDQNDDGKFDFTDVSVIAESMGNAMKKGAQIAKDNTDEKMRLLELKALQPIFVETLNNVDFSMSKFLRIVERDRRRLESEVCKDSIGYMSNQKGVNIVNIFRDSIDVFGLFFSPDASSEFYYIDPSERDCYIALDEYFDYLRVARVSELQRIAQSLGAKHFRVTYKEEKTTFSEKKVKAKAEAVVAGIADAEHNAAEKNFTTVQIAAESTFPGGSPVEPELKYLKRESHIQDLIAMRMNLTSPLLHQKFLLKLSNSSGIKEQDAIKIDAILKGLKCSGNTTVVSEAKNEARRYLEYEIEF